MLSRAVLPMAILYTLSACTPGRFPMRISRISVSPDPIVGQVAELTVELVSSMDEPNVTLTILLPDGIKRTSGDLEQELALVADTPAKRTIDICVLYQGDWRVIVNAQSFLVDGNTYSALETLRIHSETETARVVTGDSFRMTQPPGGFAEPTPLPSNPPDGVCE